MPKQKLPDDIVDALIENTKTIESNSELISEIVSEKDVSSTVKKNVLAKDKTLTSLSSAEKKRYTNIGNELFKPLIKHLDYLIKKEKNRDEMRIGKKTKIVKELASKKEEKKDEEKSSPLLKIMGIISTVGSAALLIYMFKDKIMGFFESFFNFKKIYSSATNLIGIGFNFFSSLWNNLKSYISNFTQSTTGTFTSWWDKTILPLLTAGWSWISNIFGDGFNWATDTFTNLFGGKDDDKGAPEKDSDKNQSLWVKLKNFLSPHFKRVKNKFFETMDNIKKWIIENKDSIISSIVNAASAAYNFGKDIIKGLFPNLDIEGFENTIIKIKDTIVSIWDKIPSPNVDFKTIEEKINNIKSFIEENYNDIKEIFGILSDDSKSITEKLMTPLAPAGEGNESLIRKIWAKINEMMPYVIKIKDSIIDIFNSIDFKKLSNNIKDAFTWFQNLDIKAELDWALSVWKKIKTIVDDVLNIVSKVKTAVQKGKEVVTKAVNAAAPAAKAAATTAAVAAGPAGIAAVAAVAASKTADAVQGAAKGAWNTVRGLFSDEKVIEKNQPAQIVPQAPKKIPPAKSGNNSENEKAIKKELETQSVVLGNMAKEMYKLKPEVTNNTIMSLAQNGNDMNFSSVITTGAHERRSGNILATA
jgi:hypothetical protein